MPRPRAPKPAPPVRSARAALVAEDADATRLRAQMPRKSLNQRTRHSKTNHIPPSSKKVMTAKLRLRRARRLLQRTDRGMPGAQCPPRTPSGRRDDSPDGGALASTVFQGRFFEDHRGESQRSAEGNRAGGAPAAPDDSARRAR